MASHSPAPEDRVGPYVLEEIIGRGGFGEVWRARHSVLDQGAVAAKIPTDGAYIGVLRTEGILQHNLKHPLIVEMIDIDLDHDPPYLIMEHIQGEDLRKRIRRDAPMPLQDVVSISRDILEALDHAHTKGIVHRDLKPENVLLPEAGGIKLTDFGLGKAMDASRSILLKSQTMRSEELDRVAGTLAYMAPEQLGTSRTIDARTDLYAFGILFFEMITGQLPVGPTLPSEIIPGLDPAADRVYRRCCAPIQGRYGSASGRIVEDLVSLAPAPRRQPRPLPDGLFGPVEPEPIPEPVKDEPVNLDEWKGPVTWFLGVFFIWIIISPALLGLIVAVFRIHMAPRSLATWWILLNVALTVGLFAWSSRSPGDGSFRVISPDHADDPFRGHRA